MRAIIFDFDGTIADSFKVVVEIAHGLTHRGQLVQAEEIERLRHLRMLDVASELHIPKWRWPFLLMRGRAMMSKRMREIQPFPGLPETLRTLHDDGYELFVMSSNSRQNVDRFLAEHGMATFFTTIYGGVGFLGKARALKKILKANKLMAADVVYVGDEPRDVMGSKQVGIPCVAVSWGYNAPQLLAEHAPMVVVRTAEQLRHVLEEWGSEI